jgi:hypothetical protein
MLCDDKREGQLFRPKTEKSLHVQRTKRSGPGDSGCRKRQEPIKSAFVSGMNMSFFYFKCDRSLLRILRSTSSGKVGEDFHC